MAFHSFASEDFWERYAELPQEVQRLADKQYALFQQNPFHPSLALKGIGEAWCVRVGNSYRALAYREGSDFFWFWIGTHEAYNKLLKRLK